MKKIIVTILAFLYLGVSSGIVMEIHYCMGKKAGIEIYGTANDQCGKCGMKNKPGCCNDETKFYKLSDSHKNVSNNLSLESPVAVIENTASLYQLPAASNPLLNEWNNHAPPVYSGPSGCILHCVFRL